MEPSPSKLDYFEFHTTSERFLFIAVSSRCFGPPRSPYEPIDLRTAKGRQVCGLRPASWCRECSTNNHGGKIAPLRWRQGNRFLSDLWHGWWRRRLKWCSRNTRITRRSSGFSSGGYSFRRAPGRCRLCAGCRFCICRPHTLSRTPDRGGRGPSVFGGPAVERIRARANWRARTASPAKN